jgi:hypothetical protein
MDCTRRVFAVGGLCVVVAATSPAALSAGPLGPRAWAATAIPQATLATDGTGFGISALSSDGRVAVVAGAQGVHVFRASPEGSWDSISKPAAWLRLPRSALANLSAVATSSDGTTVLMAAGAVGNDPAAAYVFHVSSPRAWSSRVTPTAKLTDAADPSGFGAGVALSSDGTTALVGARGGADVFHVATADSWWSNPKPTARLVADPISTEAGGLGIAVALSADGTTALIGATNLSTLVGAAYVFRAAAEGAWVSTTTPNAVLTDGVVGLFGDGFGGAVALDPAGTTALVGAPNIALGPSGAAYFFRVASPNAWTSTADPDAVAGRHSGRSGAVPGWSVALSGEGTALVGEPSVLGKGGAADVLDLGGFHDAKLTDAASRPRDLFGASVGLSADGTTALVSSVRASVIFTRSGSRNPTHCYVPYLEGKALHAAKRTIESTHCRIGKVTRIRASRSKRNHVISQTPKPGKRFPMGATIALSVAQRS